MSADLHNSSCRVMVVDDDETNLLLTTEVLRLFGVQTIAWSSPVAAFRTFEEEVFDLIFMDVHMPEMNGLELADKIRVLEQATGRPRTPIVALTASVMQHELEECLLHGMDEVMTKPFRFTELEEALRRWCRTYQ